MAMAWSWGLTLLHIARDIGTQRVSLQRRAVSCIVRLHRPIRGVHAVAAQNAVKVHHSGSALNLSPKRHIIRIQVVPPNHVHRLGHRGIIRVFIVIRIHITQCIASLEIVNRQRGLIRKSKLRFGIQSNATNQTGIARNVVDLGVTRKRISAPITKYT